MADQWKNRIVATGDEAPDQLLANPHNWRIHPKAQRDALAAVLDDVGWVQRVIVNKTTDHVVDGHLRVALALSREEPTIPVSYVELDPREESLVLASLDPIAAMATTDQDKLRSLLEQAEVNDQTLRDALGDAAGLSNHPKPGNTDADDVPEERRTEIQRGDLFALGDHRLLCGDSTNADDVARVTGGRVDLCLTDPPYANGELYASHNDTAKELENLISAFFPLARDVSDRILITPGNANQRMYPKPDWTLCWMVPAGVGRSAWGFSCWQPVMAYGSDPYLAKGLGGRPDALNQTESAENTLGHPCPKPVGVWAWFMERGSANKQESIFDPFAGSGTTIIAAEQLNRRCYAIEIEPTYCQVIIDRWEAFAGKQAKKVKHARTKTKANRAQKTKRQPRTPATQ